MVAALADVVSASAAGVAAPSTTRAIDGVLVVSAIDAVAEASTTFTALADAVKAIDALALASFTVTALADDVTAIDADAEADAVSPALALVVKATGADALPSRSAAVFHMLLSSEYGSASRLLDQLSSSSKVGPTISVMSGSRHRQVAAVDAENVTGSDCLCR